MRTSGILALALCLMATVAFAHVGVTVFYPEVPDPAAITIDGNDDDWGWYDPALALNQPDFWDRANDFVEISDYDFTFLNGWTRPPDNRWYGFARFVDDTLKFDSPVKEWWKDDCLQIAVDPDHSGGGILGENLEEIGNGQRWHIRILPQIDPLLPAMANGAPIPFFYSQLEFIDAPELLWAVQPDFIEAAWTVLPAGAENLTVGVTYTIEWRMALWDIWGLSEVESTRHQFAEDDVIGLAYRPMDSDRPGGGRKHSMYINDGSAAAAVNADMQPDFWALAAEGGGTAVENESWGHIKNSMNQRLR